MEQLLVFFAEKSLNAEKRRLHQVVVRYRLGEWQTACIRRGTRTPAVYHVINLDYLTHRSWVANLSDVDRRPPNLHPAAIWRPYRDNTTTSTADLVQMMNYKPRSPLFGC